MDNIEFIVAKKPDKWIRGKQADALSKHKIIKKYHDLRNN